MTVLKKKRLSDRFNFNKIFFPWLHRLFLDHAPYPKYQLDEILAEYDNPVVGYVFRFKSRLLQFALDKKVTANSLPAATLSQFEGKDSFKKLPLNYDADLEGIEFYLKKPKTAVTKETLLNDDFIKNLFRLQDNMKRPIILLPHAFLLGTRAHHRQRSTTDMIFGSRQEPGAIRMFFRLLLCHRWAKWQIGAPLNLQEFLKRHEQQPVTSKIKQVRWFLLKRFNDVERSFYGPPLKSHSRIQRDTLRDKSLRHFVDNVQADTGVPKLKLEKKAVSYYNEVAARFDIDFIRFLNVIFSFFWKKTTGGLIWYDADIEKIKKASSKGPLIIVPSHRSHFDYMVISQLFFWQGLMLPHVAAGANLSFFPVGYFLRRGGAFFIRRTFKGDPLYPQVVKAYVHQLLKESFTQEFFIEGGRSRTGKTLPPKFGFLSIIVDCLTRDKLKDAVFLPASISYERLAEASSYQRELSGQEKKTESAKNFFKSARLLKEKFGKIYISFDEPISFAEYVKSRKEKAENQEGLSDSQLVKSLAHRIVYGMNHCLIVTPSSLIAVALFGTFRSALSNAQLIWHIKKLVHYIREHHPNTRFSDEFKRDFRRPIESALKLLADDNMIFKEAAAGVTYYRITKKHALKLDYHKNSIIHFFVSDAIIATAFLALYDRNRREKVLQKRLHDFTKMLSRIFKLEFVYPVGKSFEELFEERLNYAFDNGLLAKEEHFIVLPRGSRAHFQLQFLARLIANFVDAYWIGFYKMPHLIKSSTSKKGLIANLLEQLKTAYISGVSEFPEIVNKSLASNIVKWLEDSGAIKYVGQRPTFVKKNVSSKLARFNLVLRNSHFNR